MLNLVYDTCTSYSHQVKLTSTPCRFHWTARWTRSDLQRAQNQSDVDDDDDNVYDDYDDDDGDDDDDNGVTFNEAGKSYQSDRLSSEKFFPHFFVYCRRF